MLSAEATHQLHTRSLLETVQTRPLKEAPPLRLNTGTVRFTEDFRYIEEELGPQEIAADEIEVRIYAIGLTFKDYLIATGKLR